jgi:hypothetical protein
MFCQKEEKRPIQYFYFTSKTTPNNIAYEKQTITKHLNFHDLDAFVNFDFSLRTDVADIVKEFY